ncbi:ABC transporter substrate-binding protein [Paenibacillus oceani]|uniref:Extracellular solute-binding protein n=1 Tax=Paenibacillus oceani TaxID=2772510 RepID=A0A927H0Z9_9BACL|nr:extracellular solute-binding protein [Paenibacillus oceani]MBD2862984.1 extracellular solute-binding protein [Paenibacillus oceani]
MIKKAITVSLGAMLVLTGCGAGGQGGAKSTDTPQPEASKPVEKAPDPVTLKMYDVQQFTDDDFNRLIVEPVKKKYPHITVERMAKANNPIDNVIATKQQFDLATLWHGGLPSQNLLDYLEDMTALIQKNKFDLGRFDPNALDAVRKVSNGGLFGIPYNVNFNALYYNKDIFDKFGVGYPKDGMTWDETIELAKKLTRSEGGVQYKGLDPDGHVRMMFPLSLNLVDPKTNTANINANDQLKRVFEMGKTIHDIPGNEQQGSFLNVFPKDKTIAMLATSNFTSFFRDVPNLNWDIAQYPSYKERPNVYGMYDLHVMAVPKTSKLKDDAFKVIEVLMSDEVQLDSVKVTGRVSPLKDQKFKDNYGVDQPGLKGKNVKAIFKSKPAEAPEFSRFYSDANAVVTAEYKDYLAGKKDVNSALRDAEEKINQAIKTKLGK